MTCPQFTDEDTETWKASSFALTLTAGETWNLNSNLCEFRAHAVIHFRRIKLKVVSILILQGIKDHRLDQRFSVLRSFKEKEIQKTWGNNPGIHRGMNG